MASLQQNNHQQHNPAFVLGNGVSRLQADLPTLSHSGTVYGCNALYREYSPDYLIAVDVKMVNEIIESGYNKTHEVWTNPNRGISAPDNLNLFNPHLGWSSGPTALWLASKNGHKEVFILGFDYEGLNGKVNNVYASTPNYKEKEAAATFFGNWSSQTEKVIKDNPHIQYYRVLGDKKFIPPNFTDEIKNLKHITYGELDAKFPRYTYISQNDQKTTI